MTWAGMAHHFNYSLNVCDEDHSCRYAGPEQFVNFSFRSVYFVRMKLQWGAPPPSGARYENTPVGRGLSTYVILEK